MYEYGVRHILQKEYKTTANRVHYVWVKLYIMVFFAMCMVYFYPSTIVKGQPHVLYAVKYIMDTSSN